MPQYFRQLSRKVASTERKIQLDRMRVETLGLTDDFLQRMARTLTGKTGREYTPAKTRKIILWSLDC